MIDEIPEYDDMDEEEFYRLLFDHYVTYQDVPGIMRLWDVDSPSSFMPRSPIVDSHVLLPLEVLLFSCCVPPRGGKFFCEEFDCLSRLLRGAVVVSKDGE